MFTKELENGSSSHVPAYFTSKVQDIDGARDIDLEALASDLSAQWSTGILGVLILP